MRIQHSYLAWVGADHYETASEFIDEARKLGVSKRLPGLGMAGSLNASGTVIFLAHDDGEAFSCDACMGQVECSSCRSQSQLIAKWQEEADAVKKTYQGEPIPRGKARIIEIREMHIANARAAMKSCEVCDGTGSHECGTGGYVVRKDGSRMDYRAYNYWMRQPKKFDAEREIVERHMCEACGGIGKHPAGAVFGAFVPSVEVVVNGREHEVVREKIEAFEQVSLSEVSKEPERNDGSSRRGGKRRPGYYAVARAGRPTKRAQALAAELVAQRAVRGDCEVIGDIVLFAKPVRLSELKRFRGLKRWTLPALRRAETKLSA
jgi:hypothetical protein